MFHQFFTTVSSAVHNTLIGLLPGSMDRLTSFDQPRETQSQSPFFAVLPGEVRDRIYTYALSCSNDQAQTWDKNSSWVRPGYEAPQKVDTALLRACQQCYTEAWFRPWLSTTHSFWLAWGGRRPDKCPTPATFQKAVNQLFTLHGNLEIEHVRVFAQLCSLEAGSQLGNVLSMNHFFPKVFSVTIRHHDWYFWEHDNRLHIGAQWVNRCRFPSSVIKIKVELESLQRKKNQVDYIAEEIVKKWQFLRQDDVVMTARAEDYETDTWSGSSTWEGDRWIRDETKPQTNEYYIKTVVFKPDSDVSAEDRLTAEPVGCPEGMFQQISSRRPTLSTEDLTRAGVQPRMTADEARRAVDNYRENADHDQDTGRGGGDSNSNSNDDNGNDDDDDDDDSDSDNDSNE